MHWLRSKQWILANFRELGGLSLTKVVAKRQVNYSVVIV